MEVLTLRLEHSLKVSCDCNFIITVIITFAIIIRAISTSCIHCLSLVWNLCSMPWDSNNLNDRYPIHGEREPEILWGQQA